MTVELYHGDCLVEMDKIETGSIGTIITDPPYGLKFMGKEWDHGVPGVVFWKAFLRVAKPGAMLLAFGGTRTHHRLMCAIEDAEWEIRDCLMWLYGQGFPKSRKINKGMSEPEDTQLWNGYGTALKPAWEPIILAMKPKDGTFAHNALAHGVAGLWVDGGRIPVTDAAYAQNCSGDRGHADNRTRRSGFALGCGQADSLGRWPANLILDEDAGAMLDEQSGIRPGMATGGDHKKGYGGGMFGSIDCSHTRRGDTGGASRFFYCAKASRKERTCDGTVENNHPTVKPLSLMRYLVRLTKMPTDSIVLDPFMGSGSTGRACIREGRSFIGIEKGVDEFTIAQRCISYEETAIAEEAQCR